MSASEPVSVVHQPITVTVDIDADTITVFGIRYSLALFRLLGFAPLGTTFRILDRPDGTVTLLRMDEPQQDPQLPTLDGY